MKFTIQKSVFMKELSDVIRAISSRTTIPILSGVKITVNESGLTLVGSDVDISIESFLSVNDESTGLKIEEPGDVVVVAGLFHNIVRKLPSSTITFESDERNLLTITSGSAVFTLNGQSGSDYPYLPDFDMERRFTLPTTAFKELIAHTIISVSQQESRPILTGINLTAHDGYLSGVSTDSHRLSRREIPVELTREEMGFDNLTIPHKTMLELSRIIEDNQTLEMAISGENQVVFFIDHVTIYTRLLEGNYPDTNRLIPEQYQTELIVNASEFLDAIDRAGLMAQQGKNNAVQLEISPEQVELSVRGNERGQAKEGIQSLGVTGDALTISFNPDYMKDALRTFSGADIKLQFQTAVRPILMLPVEESDTAHNSLLQLLTPIRTH